MMTVSAVGYEENTLQNKARELAKRLNFIVDKNAQTCLFLSKERLSLKMPGFSPISIELSPSFWMKRKVEGKKQAIVRACRPSFGLKIIDATAGWGRDSCILASFGARVLMLERNLVMATLLEDALNRATDKEQQQLNLALHFGDAFNFIDSLEKSNYPDVIYIDPMHPQRTKSALVKKEMQILQEMIAPENDSLPLIELSRTRVTQRVVVKWPQKIKPLLPADASIGGKTVRFDIYLPSATKTEN